MRFNDKALSGLRLMPEDELDREMRGYCEERAAEEQAEAAIRAARWRKPDEADATVPPTGVGRPDLSAATAERGGITAEETDKTDDPELDRLLAALVEDKAQAEPTATLVTPTYTPDTVTTGEPDPTKMTTGAVACTTTEPVAAPGAAPALPFMPAAKDSFPVYDDHHLGTEDEPAARLQILCSELARHHDYHAIRDEYCVLSIRMNLLGKVAPAFRPPIKPGKPHKDPVYQLIHRDQLVIDMHWCHVLGFSLSPIEPEHAALFATQASFTFAGAWALASRKLKKAYRAGEALCLTTFQQCQLLTLRDPELLDRVNRIEQGYRSSGGKSVSERARATRAIRQWAERDTRIEKEQRAYEHLWYARALLGPGATRHHIAMLQALMAGKEALDPTTVAAKLRKLDRALTAM